MSIVKTVGDYFRSSLKGEPVDRYGILSPLLASGEYVTATTEIYTLFKNSVYADFVSGKIKPINKYVEKAIDAYKQYVKGLPSHEQQLERVQPFSTILLTLESIKGNIEQIEDNFQPLFGNLSAEKPETNLRSSSLIIIGYLEKADAYATWLGGLVEHLTADGGDMIPPFRTKEMLSKASDMAEFTAFNLHKWNYKHESLLAEVKEMQRKGSDLAIQTGDGAWLDEFAHDNQFSPMEQTLMTASMRNPILMLMTRGHVAAQEYIDLLTTRKDWLTAKIIQVQSKMRGMDPDSDEYKRLKKATDRYADLTSKYEQKIERMRG